MLPLQASPAGAAQSGPSGQDAAQRPLLEQKLKLLETYLASTSAKVSGSSHAEAEAEVERARALLQDAKAKLMADDLAAAATALDQGLKAIAAASAKLTAKKKGARPSRVAAADYERLKGQIESYLDSITGALSEQGRGPEVEAPMARIEGLMGRAEKQAASRDYDQASRSLKEAYELTVTLVSGLRKGETVISRLHFETPADELEYERRRHGSYEMLVQLMVQDKAKVKAGLQPLAERFIAESRKLRDRADQEADKGDYDLAIQTMEEATRKLVRVLQAGGVPVYE